MPAFVALLALALATSSAAEAAGGCRPSGSKTVVAGKHARVFTWRGIAYGCLYSRGVRFALTNEDEVSESELGRLRPRLAGRFVGYAYVWEGAVTGGDGVAVTDLRRGRTRRIELDSGSPREPEVVIRDLVVTARGSMAWTWAADYKRDEPAVHEVRKLEARGSARRLGVLLDSGPDIDLVSLTARRSRLFWLKGDERMSARLR